MSYYKFISTPRTNKECYIRCLFGNNGESIEKTGEELDVDSGDTLFLHTLSNEGPDRLDGPFVAISDAGEEIQPYAWRHHGYYNWQVEIDWEDTVHSMTTEDINSSDEPRPIEIKPHPQKFSEVQGQYLGGLLKREGVSIINATNTG